MSTSITISGLNELFNITQDDFIAFVDSASLTTFRVSVETLKDFFATSGSVLSASFASQSISASYAVNADTASYLFPRLYFMTASFAQNIVPGNVVGSASLALHALTASRLEGIGSSFENVMVINSNLSTTGSGYVELPARPTTTSSLGSVISVKTDSVFFNKDYQSGVNGYGRLYYFDDNLGRGKMIFDIGDSYNAVNTIGPNIDNFAVNSRGFLFETNEAGNSNNLTRTGSLLFISSSGRTYGRIFEAQEYSSSFVNSGKVGFYGTASYALITDFSVGSANIIPTGMIVGYVSASAPTGWLDCNGSIYDPSMFPALGNLIGTNYGRALVINNTTTPETVTTYHNASDGTIKISWVSGGSGLFQVSFGANTYFLNSATSPSVTITGLSGPVTYNYAFSDIGFNPQASYSSSALVPYGGTGTNVNSTLAAATFRVPQLDTNYFKTFTVLNPFIWIIKT